MTTRSDESAITSSEDAQILDETISNERQVEHPTYGRITLVMPNLEIQRKIEFASRKRRKQLLAATDEIEDPSDPAKVKRVPAYMSREALAAKYREQGWWSDEQDKKIEELNDKVLSKLTELELLGFETEEAIYEALADLKESLMGVFEEHEQFEEVVRPTIVRVCNPSTPVDYEDEKFLRAEAPNTDVDEALDEVVLQKRLYASLVNLYEVQVELIGLRQEYLSLFSDCWQEQMQYFVRLAQLYYCSYITETGTPVWDSLEEIEKEKDTNKVQWLFAELDAFWRGITDDVREKMDKYSFMYRRNERKESSEDLPAPSRSNEDGDSQESKQIISSEVSDTTES